MPFIAVDNPNATELTTGIMAVMAQHEAKMCSDRTKAALQAAKARGVKLGGYRGVPPTEGARMKANSVRTAAASARAVSLQPVIAELRSAGTSTLADFANGLNARGIAAPRGGKWHPPAVRRLLQAAAAG